MTTSHDTDITETGWLGHRPVSLDPGPARLGLSPGIAVEWREASIPADAPGGVTARPVTMDGLDGVEVDIPQGVGWTRLRIDLPPAPENRITGLRILMRLAPRQGGAAQTGPMKAYLGLSDGAAIRPVQTGMARISYQPDTWHNVTAAIIRPGGTGSLAAMLDLPPGHLLALALVETGDHPVRLNDVARRPLDTGEPMALRPFRADPLSGEQARASAAQDPVFAASAEMVGEGLAGWALTGTTTGQARIVITGQAGTVEAQTGLETEIRPGIRAACGFRVDTLPFQPDLRSILTCHLQAETEASPGPAFLALSRTGKTGSAKAVSASGTTMTTALFVAPESIKADPYQRLLYRAMRGLEPQAGGLSGALAHLNHREWNEKIVLHLTALAPLLSDAGSADQAMAMAREIGAKLAFLTHQGAQVIWTLRAPPEGPWIEAERTLGQTVAALRGPIHLHCESLVAPLSAAWGIDIPPERRVVTPLGSPSGYYVDYASRTAARARLGIPADVPLFLVFGRLGRGKDIEAVVEAFSALQTAHPEAHLLIAGKTAPGDLKGRIKRRYGGMPHIRVMESEPVDNSLQWIFRAADWAVMPYRAGHTPEALVTAMAFGRPIIAPNREVIARIVPDGAGLLYEVESSDGLTQSLFQALAFGQETARSMGEVARDAMAHRSWAPTAEALLAVFDKRVEARAVTLDFDDRPRQARLLGAPFPPERAARTAIVILNYEDSEDTARLCASLKAGTDRDFHLYIVDNCSPSVTEDELVQRFGDDRILRLPENLGYAAGNNAALQLIDGLDYRYVLILNPDLTAPPDALERLVAAAEAHHGPAVFGPALLRGGDPGRVASAGSYLDTSAGLVTGHMYAGEVAGILPDAPYEADFVTGAALFFSRETLDRIGTLPEDYFLYFEESDWLTRARAMGVPSIVRPDIRLQHHKRSEAGGLPAPYYFYYYIRNSRIFAHRLAERDPERAPDPEMALTRLQTEFIEPQLKRIRRGAHDRLGWFKALARQALADGEADRLGTRDLTAGLVPTEGLPWPDAEVVAGLKVRLDTRNDGNPVITGTLTLPAGAASSGPWRLTAIRSGQILASADALPAESGPADRLRIEMPLPMDRFTPGRSQTVTLFLNSRETGTVSAYLAYPKPLHDGEITGLDAHCCTGWLRDKTTAGRPVIAEIWTEDRLVGRGPADLSVEQGNCGFSIRLPRALSDGTERVFKLRAEGSKKVIAEATLSDRVAQTDILDAEPDTFEANMFYRQEIWFDDTEPDTARAITGLRQLTDERRASASRATGAPVAIALPVQHRDNLADLHTAIDSVLAQSHTDWELRIAAEDVRLRDRVAELIGPDPDPRIRILPIPRTLHTRAEARNLALAGTDRPVFAHIDAGSAWDRDYLAIQLAALDTGARAVVCAQWLTQDVLDSDGKTVIREAAGLRSSQPTLPRLENRPGPDLSALVTRREVHEELGGFDPALPAFEDWELMLRLADISPPLAIPALLVATDIGPAPLRLKQDPARKLGLERIAVAVDRIHAGFGASDRDGLSPARQTDIAVLATDIGRITGAGSAERIARRLRDIAASLPDPGTGRVLAVLPPGLAAPVGRVLGEEPYRIDLQETGSILPENTHFDLLKQALSWRRKDADLVLMRPNGMLLGGAIATLRAAANRRPRSGILVPRHGVGGRDEAAGLYVPGCWQERDVCIAISHKRGNLLEPALDLSASLALLSAPDPFCLCLLPEVAEAMERSAPPEDGADLDTLLGPWAAQHCLALGREIVYCGRARAFEMPF